YDPPPGVPRRDAIFAEHVVPIRDARPLIPVLSLDREGFQLVRHDTQVRDFYDEDELKRVYYPEVEELVKEVAGAVRVQIFDHTLRNGAVPERPTEKEGEQLIREPVFRVHNDYTEKSAPQRVRDIMGAEADDLLNRRFAIINVWRPLRGPVEEKPLALCDARSVSPGDWIATDLLYPDRTGEIYYVAHNPAQRWFYFPKMMREEAVLLKCFDSATDGRARFIPHTAFADPTSPPNAPPRESIEIRTIAFFDEVQKLAA
ncbi:MAG TPA: CmcJ/NvfI family oxidoreductase, partial [Dongiaceae bacterium]